jgi:hypothetical protein
MAAQGQDASGYAHTPGPWSVEPPYTTGGVCFEGYAPISAETWGALAKVAVEVDREPSAEGEANARLIAAAPAMLEALLAQEDRHQRGLLNMTDAELSRVTELRREAIRQALSKEPR